jgi:hypothetical protein
VVKRLLLAAALALAPVTAAAAPSLDGYSFETEQFEHRDLHIIFVPVEKQTDLRALAEIHGIHLHDAQIKAFSLPYGTTCAIYAVDPKVAYEPEFLGHELAHCIYGNFHPKKDKDIK